MLPTLPTLQKICQNLQKHHVLSVIIKLIDIFDQKSFLCTVANVLFRRSTDFWELSKIIMSI